MSDSVDAFFSKLDLTEYEEAALEELLLLGRTTAPDLAEATGIPKARIYGVLDSLSEAGFVKVIPGRPKQYQPHDPSEIVDRAITNRQDAYEQFKHDVDRVAESFIDSYTPVQDRSVDELSPTEDLFHVVDVGEPSERETRRLLRNAEQNVCMLTKSFGYIETVGPAMREAVDRGVTIDILMLSQEHLTAENSRQQQEIRSVLADRFPSVTVRVTDRVLPWRGRLPTQISTTRRDKVCCSLSRRRSRTTSDRPQSRETPRSSPGCGSISISSGTTRADPSTRCKQTPVTRSRRLDRDDRIHCC